MKSIKYLSFALALSLICGDVRAQEHRENGEWLRIDENLVNSIVTATYLNYHVVTGLLHGMKGDSIYVSSGVRVIPVDLNDLQMLSIEYEKQGSQGAVIGMLSGVYLGSLFFYTSKNSSAKYLEYEEGLEFPAAEALCLIAGGGIGYLFDIGSREGKKVFYFGREGEDNAKEIRNLKDFLEDKSNKRRLRINFYASYINTRLSEFNDRHEDYYPYTDVTRLNLLRKLSVTYEVYDNLEFGIALSWFGEPYLSYSSYVYSMNSYSTSTNQSYEGKGYYLLVNYKPLKRIIPENLDFVIGAGIGTGKVDYHLTSETITYAYPESYTKTIEHKINRSLFSALFSSEIRYYLYPVVNISLQADYIYLPEKMPAVPSLDLKEKDLGGFGFGFGFGLNF